MKSHLAILALLWAAIAQAADLAEKTAAEIRREALRPPSGTAGRPLPLAATWSPYQHNFTPDYQLNLIKKGHHLILCFGWPWHDTHWGDHERGKQAREKGFKEYYEPALREAARLKLPISFQRFQFEMELTSEKRYFDLPPEQNPNVVSPDGKVQRMVDPMGPIEHWHQLGKEHVSTECMRLVQEVYPDPPLVIFLSNNEHTVLQYRDAEKSKRYLDKYGTGKSAAFKQKIFEKELVRRYRALQKGICEGLVKDNWKKNARFFAYDAFGPPHLGRWGGWIGYSFFTPESGRMMWQHLGWDGGSPSYYTHDWAAFTTDYTSAAIQVEAMNWVFMLRDALKENPNFWFELSTWDGDQYGINGKRAQYLAQGGQVYTPERYQGMLQFGLWLLRPRALRDFRYLESREYAEPYFLANVKAVDAVYGSPLLQRFWRHGELVPNPDRQHPYQVALTDALKAETRWYLLSTDLESPAKDWGLYTEILVFPLALVLGKEPEREWLVFAHAPRAARTGVTVKLPGFGEIKIDASVTGSFYHVTEKDKAVKCVIPGGPLCALPTASKEQPKPGELISFRAADVFNSNKADLTFAWDFADGSQAAGAEVEHAFSKKGLYLVSLTTKDGAGNISSRHLPVSVGYPDLDACLCCKGRWRQPRFGLPSPSVPNREVPSSRPHQFRVL